MWQTGGHEPGDAGKIARMRPRSQVLLLGGRSGVGKSTVAFEMHEQLARADVMHALIEGDFLDLAHPTPHEQGLKLAELNLAAMWRNYTAAGYSRLIYVNTAVVLKPVIASLVECLADDLEVRAVLLTAGDDVVAERLTRREIGSGLEEHISRSAAMAPQLESGAPSWVHRVTTDDRPVADIAAEILALSGWPV